MKLVQPSVLLALGLALLPRAATAQEDDIPPPPSDDGAKPAASAEDEDVPAPPSDQPTRKKPRSDASASGSPRADAAADGKSKTGLGQDETIYVVQRKPVSVKYAFEFAPQFMQSVNDRFTIHTGGSFSGLFHFRENFALQLTVGGLFGRDASITREIREKESLKPELVQLIDHTWMTTADLQWTPLYGKVSILDFLLGQFGVYFSIGGGLMGNRLRNQFRPDVFSGGTRLPWEDKAYDPVYESPLDANEPLPDGCGGGTPFCSRFLGQPAITATIGGGVRFYLNNYLGFRVELKDYVQANRVNHRILTNPEQTSTVDISNTYMLQLGVTLLTPRLPLGGGRQ
jgi:outer membrane beta-barrel protein